MEKRNFNRINNLIGWVVFALSAIVYLCTLEPTASFWDCGEFIASSYKLEIGHPPGNPTFQLLGRLFSLFGNAATAALLINAMSALCSAFTILFLFWTISHLGRRLVEVQHRPLDLPHAIAVWGAAAVGALTFAFTDTFWFSAVEAEVYAMSSLFTALVVWAMLKWEDCANEPYANRWIVLIAYLMGLSIGVHLLNLLTIPALVFIYYYKKYPFTWKGALKALLLSGGLILLILYGIIPWVPKLASWFDLLFVNTFHLPFNSGFLFFVVALLCLLFWGVLRTFKKQKVFWNTVLLCLTVIIIGYCTFAMVVIRSVADTPTNENQPDNAFALGSYLGREQYGSAPLLYGQTYNSSYGSWSAPKRYAKIGNRYERVKGMDVPTYAASDNMLFPRMHSRRPEHESFYNAYTGKGPLNADGNKRLPTFGENIVFFLEFQVHYMYWRYFMWNFAGRQNDLQGVIPGDAVRGNWECGIPFIDRARLGDQSQAPEYLAQNVGKNHYYMLPLLLGLIGFFYQLNHDKRNTWITFLLFFLTGLAIVVYLNQPPYQPRERDYAYAGSFYAFAVWIGLGVMGLYDVIRTRVPKAWIAGVLSIICLAVPTLVLAQNWDDHDRSHRRTAPAFAYNALTTCTEDVNAILITHGDNDTFPLWYLQEVESVGTSVRVVNTSLLGTDWYIDQMKRRQYESAPLELSIPRVSYLMGANDIVPVHEIVKERVWIKEAVDFIGSTQQRNKVQLQDGSWVSYLPTRKLRVPVNRENALACGIVTPENAHKIPEYIDLDIPEAKNAFDKSEMMILDLLANYQWDRPIYLISDGILSDLDIDKLLHREGMLYKLLPYPPVKEDGIEFFDANRNYDLLMNTYQWGNMEQDGVLLDYFHHYVFVMQQTVRHMYARAARAMILEGDLEKAEELLDKGLEVMQRYPLMYSAQISGNELGVLEMIELYYYLEREEKGRALAIEFLDQTMASTTFFLTPYRDNFLSIQDAEQCIQLFGHVTQVLEVNNEKELAQQYNDQLEALFARFQ